MSLAQPAYLLLLPLGGLVALMHLLRPKRRDAVVSSLVLWTRFAREARSQSLGRRIAEVLLVLARVLALVLTVFALARPFAFLALPPGDVVIVLDSSASMLACDESPTRFDKARDEAVRFVAGLRGRPAITVIDAGPRPEAVLTRARDRRAALAALTSMRPYEARAGLESAMDLAFSIAKPAERDTVAVFTDGAYDDAPFLERFRAPHAPSLRVSRVGSETSSNIGITSIEFRPDARNNGDADGFAAIANYSGRDEEVEVGVRQDERLLTTSRIRVAAGASKGFAFRYPTFAGTVCTVEVSPGGDLRADDVAQAVFPADGTVRVLVVGEESPSLVRALRAIPQVVVGTSTSAPALSEGQLGGADVVVYVKVPPAQVTAPGAILVKTPSGGESVEAGPETGAPVVLDCDRTHPVMRFVDLSSVAIQRAQVLTAPPAARVLVESSAGPLVWATESLGQRTVAFGFDPEDSDLTRRPSFPIMVRNMVGWLAPDKLDLDRVATRCGEPVAIRVSPGSRTLGITDPAGRLSRTHDPPPQFTFGDTVYAGIYSVRDDGGESLFAANLASPEESNVAPRAASLEPVGREAGATPTERRGQWDATTAVLAAVLALLTVEWILTARGRGPRPASTLAGGRRWLLHLLRSAAALCVALAATGFAVPTRTSVQTIVFVADRSGSVSPGTREAQDRFIRGSVNAMRPPDMFGAVAFGSESYLDCEVGPRQPDFTVSSRPGEAGTDIESALRVALQTLPPGPGRRIVLLSDGNETRGDALAAAADAASAGVPVDVVLQARDPAGEVAMTSVSAPETVGLDEPFELRIAVSSTRQARAVMTVHQNLGLVVREEVALSAGRNVFILPMNMAQPGLSVFCCRVAADPDSDRLSENNVAFGHVTAWSRPRVLLASGTEASRPLLGAMLKEAGMLVDSASPDGVPGLPELAGYDLLILEDVPAGSLSASEMSSIAEYVRHFGGGLIVTGGRNSFGLGGYRDTPLEDVLPVWSDVRERVAFPALAAVIVLDRSGSMSTTQGGTSKLDLAREAAYSAVELVNETDKIGVLAFDTECFWAVPVQTASHRAEIAEGLSKLTAEGGTSLYPAMVEAHRKLVDTPAMVKHMIVLSDGVSASADFERVSRGIASDGITVTTVAVGQDADIELMKNIADWGRGRAYYTEDIYAIPRILATEALVMSRSLAVEEPFVPAREAPAPFLADVEWEDCPPLGGYVVTSLKPRAGGHLVSAIGDPVLASWNVGLGRSIAFTSSVGSPWGREWSSWNGAARIWAQAARWAQRARDPGTVSATAHVSEGVGRVVVDAVDESGAYLNFMDLAATVLGPDGSSRPVKLMQLGPGRYEGRFDAAEQGVYLAAVAGTPGETRTPGLDGVVLAGASSSYPEEYRATEANLALLLNIAATTRGRVLGQDDMAFGTRERAVAMRRPVTALLLLALAWFLTYLALATIPSDFRAQLKSAVEQRWTRARRARELAGQEHLPDERYEDLVWAGASRGSRDTAEPQWASTGRVDDRGLDYAARVYFARLRKEHAGEGDRAPRDPA